MNKIIYFRTFGSFFNILIGALGAGVLALPYAYKNSGLIFGSIVIIIIAIIYGNCVYMLAGTSQNLCRKHKIPQLTYAETAEKAFESGPFWMKRHAQNAKTIVEIGMMSSAFSACVSILFAATTFQKICHESLNIELDLRVFVLIVAIPEFLISQIKHLKVLAPISAMANIFIMTTITIVLFYIFRDGITLNDDILMIAPIERWPKFLR